MTITGKLWMLIALIVVIGTLDLAFTLVAMNGGWLLEQNPVAGLVLSAWGGWGLVVFKAVTTIVACTAFWVAVRFGWPRHRRLLTCGAVAIVLIQSLLLMHWSRCLVQFL